jgi:hypothetical protein
MRGIRRRPRRGREAEFFVRRLVFLCLCLLFAGCSRGNAVLVLDRYWPLFMKTEEELRDLVAEAERDSGMKISLLRSDDEDGVSVSLERYLAEEEPRAVLTGAFSALNLRPVAESFPHIRFYVFDAPPGRLPPRNPFIWLRFDARPLMPELAGKISAFLKNSAETRRGDAAPGSLPVFSSALAFLEPVMDEYFKVDTVLSSLDIRRIQISEEESDELIRGRITDALNLKPALYIIAAGRHTAMILDLVRQQGSPGSLVLDGGGDMPALAGFPLLASLERSYSGAIRLALRSEAGPGDIVPVPMEIH